MSYYADSVPSSYVQIMPYNYVKPLSPADIIHSLLLDQRRYQPHMYMYVSSQYYAYM